MRAAQPPPLNVVRRDARSDSRGNYLHAVTNGVRATPQAARADAAQQLCGAASAAGAATCPSATMQPEPPQPPTMARAAADGGAIGAGATEICNLPKLRVLFPEAPAAQAARGERVGRQRPSDVTGSPAEACADGGVGSGDTGRRCGAAQDADAAIHQLSMLSIRAELAQRLTNNDKLGMVLPDGTLAFCLTHSFTLLNFTAAEPEAGVRRAAKGLAGRAAVGLAGSAAGVNTRDSDCGRRGERRQQMIAAAAVLEPAAAGSGAVEMGRLRPVGGAGERTCAGAHVHMD